MYKNRIKARDTFLSAGQVKADVPVSISESWSRSLSYKIDPNLRKTPEVLNQMDVHMLQESSLLYHAYQSIIPKIQSFIHTKYSIMLADHKARLLHVNADHQLMELLTSFNAVPGGVWSEELCGTTAFGTTLVAGQPVVIHDAQHFCESWQNISCAGVPIFHPITKQVIGVLDLTSFAEDFPAHALVLTQTVAKSMEMEIFNQLQIHRLYLENTFLEKELSMTNDLLVAIDLEGQIVRSNDPTTSDQQEWCNRLDWQRFFQSCQEQSDLSVLSTIVAAERPLPFSPDPATGRLQLVYYKNRMIGALVQMRRQPARSAKIVEFADNPSQNRGLPIKGTAKEMVGESPQWLGLLQKLDKVAGRDMSVLLIGESGTGKEVLSQYIHDHSLRRHKPFVAVNCAAFAHDLVASELFGYAPGTFTGGLKEGKVGLFEVADGGTLFLDEIAELPLPIQAMLLRVLQEKQVTRIGEYKARPLDIRIVAASNKDLKRMADAGQFRLDLYYRLNSIELKVPPLRERKEDIDPMAEHFLGAHRHGSFAYRLMPDTMDALRLYDWPGNVRELKNAIEHAVVFAEDDRIFPWHIPDMIQESTGIIEDSSRLLQPTPLDDERMQIVEALNDSRYNYTKAAKLLGISRGTLYNKMKKYEIT
ncbi:sigma-54-dependent Fis family transcriptional regulator [Brevibacillus sp. BC25]|uniref:sigma-54-dependent Fis family transcriptional regulator n=1 Tax=Brevibacillus sp. BC25 TaxID=1144308 RepID=UPI0002710AC9|nr:sigma-54-dependent Fis family transcriptional regulator [Brevibacillus sp. BC25]EJL32667.1 transcriptional activator of acetoin/glycerol metabolism [Brevibacillus sp. BC25]